MSYEVRPAVLDILSEKLAQLNRKAKKLGCELIRLEEVGRASRSRERIVQTPEGPTAVRFEYEVILMEVSGPTPKLADWTLVAKIEYLGDERLIKCVPGEECPEEFRTRGIECDHCKSVRRRTNVFVLRHEDGRHVQVGRNCISDFLGGVSPETLLAKAEIGFQLDTMFSGCDEEGDFGGYAEAYLEPVEFLTAVSICIRRLGWHSRSASLDGQATADDAWWLLDEPRDAEAKRAWDRWIEKNNLHYQERDQKLACETLEWAKSQPTTGVTDYLYNLGVAARAGFVKKSSAGILASAVQAHLRNQERADETTKKVRNHVGTEGMREVFTNLTVKTMKYIEGFYGTTTLVIFEDEPGNILKWFSSKSLDGLEVGDVVDIKATVKKHDSYKDVPQTLVSRAVVTQREVAA